jgi:hypothetical protein
MADRWVGLIEIALTFGVVLVFGLWQLRSLARLRREREAKEAAEQAAGAKPDQRA